MCHVGRSNGCGSSKGNGPSGNGPPGQLKKSGSFDYNYQGSSDSQGSGKSRSVTNNFFFLPSPMDLYQAFVRPFWEQPAPQTRRAAAPPAPPANAIAAPQQPVVAPAQNVAQAPNVAPDSLTAAAMLTQPPAAAPVVKAPPAAPAAQVATPPAPLANTYFADNFNYLQPFPTAAKPQLADVTVDPKAALPAVLGVPSGGASQLQTNIDADLAARLGVAGMGKGGGVVGNRK